MESIYHVIPDSSGLWKVQKEGLKRAHLISASKEAAIRMAGRLAKTRTSSRVLVHDQNGQIESEKLYLQPIRRS